MARTLLLEHRAGLELLRLALEDADSGETKEDIGKCVAFVDDSEAYAGGRLFGLSYELYRDASAFKVVEENGASARLRLAALATAPICRPAEGSDRYLGHARRHLARLSHGLDIAVPARAFSRARGGRPGTSFVNCEVIVFV